MLSKLPYGAMARGAVVWASAAACDARERAAMLACPDDRILGTKVLMTMVDGEVVHQAP